ncbi:histone-fold-containing protein [Cercophora scortea]|uniref:DNA polymerase epsilon subunit D n=1 Tax=Cercophora scortea TaxID=314031 RepID=A0AAE0J3T5_9PEZI|nr:histone-fold-containing protein [Cercophora scortea]
MPARKSDSRRSDVSVARFVLAEEESAAMASAGANAAAAASSASPSRLYPALERQTSTPGKSKDKESEKERERERERDAITIEDLTLPKSIITRLAKGVLPPNTQIQANAILAMSKSAVVFISHLANASNELTLNSNKKTIMPADVFKALDDIEYGFMRERLEAEFAKLQLSTNNPKEFNEVQTSKRSSYRKKVAAKKKGVSISDSANTIGDSSLLSTGSHDDDDNDDDHTQRSLLQANPSAPPRAKKARVGDSLDASRMDLDAGEPSDAETVPDDVEEEDEEEEEEEEDEEGDEEDEEEEEGDEIDERAGPDEDEDEALDGDESE